MPRYFIQISFQGTKYHGWQIQPYSATVQSRLNNALSVTLQEEISATGAGRTDTGVHASYFIAHFDTKVYQSDECADLVFRLNRFLPADIRVSSIRKVNENWHARFHAVQRTYQYVITTEKSIFCNHLSLHRYGNLDIEKMNMAAAILKDIKDFTSFSRLHGSSDNNICNVIESFWFTHGAYLIYRISADRFLRNMVRAITGTLIDIGTGKIDLQKFQQIIEMRNRGEAGTSAEAKGLFLTSVLYPDEYQIDRPNDEFPGFLLL